jgi:hypothetical protein
MQGDQYIMYLWNSFFVSAANSVALNGFCCANEECTDNAGGFVTCDTNACTCSGGS